MDSKIGSIWRIWDLHVHSPQTYGGNYADFINNATNCIADVIGINDYCSLKGYDEISKLGGIPGKTIFPVVEFRMHNIVANRKNPDPLKAGVKINFHIIFDNAIEIFSSIQTWLNSLECYNDKGETIQLGTATDFSKLTFDFEKVIEGLKKLDLLEKRYLIWLPYDEYGGIDDIDPDDNFFKLSLINKAQIIGSSTKKQIDFFKWEDDKYSKANYENWFDKPKPCIKGSDAHKIDYPFGCLQNNLSQPIDKYCWIKADTTFMGLRQITVEPDRVYIGEKPNLLKRVEANKTKFIQSLAINRIVDETVDDLWFDNTLIHFNSSLVAIIGNKGGGKSAITDILGLCGNTHQDPSTFSFLNITKFRKSKPYNLSERFEAKLIWEDGHSIIKKLNENPDKTNPERIKYVPQNFLERLCANVESDDFEREIKQIIFSHTPPDKRLGKDSLDDLIQYKSSLISDEIKQIQVEISKLNFRIVQYEEKASDDFKKSIESKLQLKKEELEAHIKIKPVETDTNDNEANQEDIKKLNEIREKITVLEKDISDLKKDEILLSLKNEEINRALQFYSTLKVQLEKYKDESNEYFLILSKYDINPLDVFDFSINVDYIESIITATKEEIEKLSKILDIENDESKTFEHRKLNEELQIGQENLDKPAKEHQAYLDNLKLWEQQKIRIEGDNEVEGSLKYYESQLSYINNELGEDLKSKYNERKILIEQLYSKKIMLLEIRKELFQPVTKFINDFKELKERYDVNIDVELELRSFQDSFFMFINQGRIGTFCGKEEGYKMLAEIIEKAQLDSSVGFFNFTEKLLSNLKYDKRNTENNVIDINSQLRKGVELNQLYDFIYNADYLQPIYNLKLGNKTLLELSPGERGALLLIFYLILDKDDIPLIIDQPEENLDNESVYHILVHFIKKVKEKRQIIIVTHNPNLAIVCDADQIIHMQIDKGNKNRVKFYSGAIENEETNKAVVDILEGTMPAFDNRDSKYLR